MPDRIPVILDTDIGSDIDDAVCLAYLLRQQRCELLGVTTVSGETSQRAALAQVICEAADRSDVPIFVPVEEAVTALLTCAAKLVSTLSDARRRQGLVMAAGPALDRAVAANRAQGAPAAGVGRELILPNGADLILPN